MKDSTKLFLTVLVLLVGSSVWFSSCNNETNMDPDLADDFTNVGIDPHELLERFIVKNAIVKTGTLHASENSPTLRTNRFKGYCDSLLYSKDIDVRHIITAPNEAYSGFSHFYFQVDGSEKFLEIKPDERESIDSIGFFYMSFDLDGLELPITFKANIVP